MMPGGMKMNIKDMEKLKALIPKQRGSSSSGYMVRDARRRRAPHHEVLILRRRQRVARSAPDTVRSGMAASRIALRSIRATR